MEGSTRDRRGKGQERTTTGSQDDTSSLIADKSLANTNANTIRASGVNNVLNGVHLGANKPGRLRGLQSRHLSDCRTAKMERSARRGFLATRKGNRGARARESEAGEGRHGTASQPQKQARPNGATRADSTTVTEGKMWIVTSINVQAAF